MGDYAEDAINEAIGDSPFCEEEDKDFCHLCGGRYDEDGFCKICFAEKES